MSDKEEDELMGWRARYVARRFRLRLIRLASRRPATRLIRRLLPLCLAVGLALGAGAWLGSDRVRTAAAGRALLAASRGWAVEGWSMAMGMISLEVDGERGRELMQSVLAAPAGSDTGPEPLAWRAPLGAWMTELTGYDFTSPLSLLEAELGGFRRAVARRMDIVRLPIDRERDEEAARPPEEVPSPGGGEEGGELPAELPDHGTTEAERPPAPVFEPLPEGIPASLAWVAERSFGDEPLVLIFHSHTSETYRSLTPDPRTDARYHIFNEHDTGITRIGAALAEKLQGKYGIGTIHTTRIHDWPSLAHAYVNSRETVEELLNRYPSIQIVLDLHRQGVDGAVYRTTVGGVEAVGIEIIYGTGETLPYGSHVNWRANESFASTLAEAMDAVHPGLLRTMRRIDNRRYNQDLHPNMLLLEVGNYLDFEEHAAAAAKLLADVIARVLAEMERRPERRPATPRARSARAAPPDAGEALPGPVGGHAPDSSPGSARSVRRANISLRKPSSSMRIMRASAP